MKMHVHACVSRWQPSPPVQNTVSSKSPTAVACPDCSTLQVKEEASLFTTDSNTSTQHRDRQGILFVTLSEFDGKFILTTHSPHLLLSWDTTEGRQIKKDLYGHEKPAKVMEFDNSYFQAWKSFWKIPKWKLVSQISRVYLVQLRSVLKILILF